MKTSDFTGWVIEGLDAQSSNINLGKYYAIIKYINDVTKSCVTGETDYYYGIDGNDEIIMLSNPIDFAIMTVDEVWDEIYENLSSTDKKLDTKQQSKIDQTELIQTQKPLI